MYFSYTSLGASAHAAKSHAPQSDKPRPSIGLDLVADVANNQRLAIGGTVFLAMKAAGDITVDAMGAQFVALVRAFDIRHHHTARAFRGGWFHTGDVGYRDPEGFFYIVDRKSDMIIRGGENIYPREVEEALLAHPAVAEVSVVGKPDREWGESVVAFVVARGAPPSAEELDSACLEHIARFKRPREYRFVTALPKNNYGKVVKSELRLLLKD